MVIERVRNSIFKNSGVWFAAFCFFFLVVGGISYSVVNQLKVKADENITELLMLSLKASHAELEDWVQNTHNDIRDIVDDPLIGGKIQKLISREGKGVSNAGSEGVLEVRALLRRHIEEHGDRDFFVVSKERKNIASMRDVDLGRKDLFEGFEDGLERVFNGETIITHFARSSDKSPAEKKDNGYVMFAGTPVYNDDGDIAAAFLVTMDPETSLKNIIDIARIFKMGDAYFFNDQGMLVTESMYEGILREAGVIKEGEGAIFNVRLIDPRTDLRFTGHGALELDKLPLTKMAESALKGNSGINISGYRDYIGAVVVGAWLWENSAELGIAVEAEVKDAYASFYTLRDIVVLGIALTALILFSFVGVLYVSGRKTVFINDALEKEVDSRIRTEHDLRLYKELMKESNDSIFVANPASGVIIDVNERATKRLGYTKEEMKGMRISDIEMVLYRDLSWKEHVSLIKEEGGAVFEGLHRCKDGSFFPVERSVRFLEYENQEYIVAIVRDITDRKKAEEEILKLSSAIEQSMVTVVITDIDGNIEYVNPSFSKLTGYSSAEAIGKNPRVLKSGYSPDSFYKELWETISSGKEWRGEFLNLKKNGEEFWEHAVISPIKDSNGSITHYLAVKENITERKKIDQALIEAKDAAEDANKAKSDFLATISHEIRTPIAAVNGVADLFKETKLDAKQKKYVNVIESASELLLNLINNVLDISKMESGKLELDYAEFNLKEVTEKMASVLSIKAEEKGLLLVEHIDDDVPLSLVGDSVRLKEALLNLLGNAVKFTEKGSVELLVSLVSEEPGESVLLRFEIKDTGVGISRDKQSMVFEKFSQADTSTTRRYGGTGLGLAITKDLVKLMGGDISVKSKVGEGSSFIFTAKFNLRSINDKSYDPKEGDLIDERPLKVLIVEDSAHIVFILQAFLSNTNYELSFAEDGKRGLDKFKEGSFDIILMDMEMPAMDGYTATKLIRELEKKDNKKDHVPIVAITAHALSEFKEKSMSAGCDAHLAKPIKKNELLAAIIKYTDGGDSLVMQGGEELHAVASKDLEMLIPEYLEDIRQEALTVEGLLEEKDFAKTQDIGHRLKGSGMTYGFIPITELGAVIEEESINKSSKAVMKAIGQLIYYLDNVKVKYE